MSSICFGETRPSPFDCRFYLEELPSKSGSLPSFGNSSRYVETWETSSKGREIDRWRKEAAPVLAKELRLSSQEQDAIWNYAAFDFGRINFILRDGLHAADPGEIKEIRQLIRAVRKLPETPNVSFRGFLTNEFGGMRLQDLHPGEIFSDPAFLSSDRNLKVAAKFAGNSADHSIILEIHGKTGRMVDVFAGNSAETEILFLPGTRFRIRSVDRIDSRTLVTLDEIDL